MYPRMLSLCSAFYLILVVLRKLATFFGNSFFRLGLFLIFSFRKCNALIKFFLSQVQLVVGSYVNWHRL